MNRIERRDNGTKCNDNNPNSERLKHIPDMFPVNKRPHAQVHHVPRRAVVVAHQVEGHGDVRVAVIEAQIVLYHNRVRCYFNT